MFPDPRKLVDDLASKMKPVSHRSNHHDDGDESEQPLLSSPAARKASKLASKGWNIKMLPVKEHMVAGHLVPALRGGHLGLIQKKRRVMLEILPQHDNAEASLLTMSRLQHVLDDGSTDLASTPSQESEEVVLNKDGGEELQDGPLALDDGATIVLRCMKIVKKGFFAKDTDTEEDDEEDDDGDPENEWTEYKRYGLDAVEYQKTVQGTYVEVRLGTGSETSVRDFHFGSEKEAQQFVHALNGCKSLQTERTKRQAQIHEQQQAQEAAAEAAAAAEAEAKKASEAAAAAAEKAAETAAAEAAEKAAETAAAEAAEKAEETVAAEEAAEKANDKSSSAEEPATEEPAAVARDAEPEAPPPSVLAKVASTLSSPPALIADVASKLPSPTALVTDVASKLPSPTAIVTDVASKLPSPPAVITDAASKLKLASTPASVSKDIGSENAADAATPTNSKSITKLATKGWNIKMLPLKEHIVGGHLVPALRGGRLGLIQKKRRVILEILPHDAQQPIHVLSASRLQQVLDEGTTILSTPAAEEEEVVLNMDGAEEKTQAGPVPLEDGATIVLRCMKLVKKGFFSKDSDTDDDNDEEDDDGDSANDWTEYKRYALDLVVHQKTTQGSYVEVRLGTGSETVVRDFHFGSDKEAEQFVRALEACKTLQTERTQRQIQIYQKELEDAAAAATKKPSLLNVFGDKPASTARNIDPDIDTTADGGTPRSGEKIRLLVEIVSALNLPVGDVFTSDPYVIVRMGNTEVHRTEYIAKTLDPIWTLQTGSLFLVAMTPDEFFSAAGGMTFVVKDFDAVGSNEILAQVSVKLQDLLKGTGERVEHELLLPNADPKKKPDTNKKQGKLVLRYKAASQDDVDFMEFYTAEKKNVGALAADCFLPPKVHSAKLLEMKTKTGPNKEALFRVKPTPDPSRVEETTWMTKEKIASESLKRSTNWIEVGNGSLGKIYVEVLGCDNLSLRNRPPVGPGADINAFACLIFEDCVVNTDVIDNDENPKWMPWCQRAFMFHIRHPSSQLMLGMFTLDEFIPGVVADSGTPIGRVVIPLTNLCPSTNYTLQFPLSTVSGKEPASSSVTLRVRIEWENERQALIASFSPRSPIYVSVAKLGEFSAAYYTAEGKVEPEVTFTPAVLSGYIEELTSYLGIIDLVLAAVTTVLLWRGTSKVGPVLVPVHSITAFIWGVLVTQNFNRLPSFWLFSIAWFFLATMEYARSNPSKWHRCRSYIELLQILAVSKSFAEEIPANDNLAAIKAHEEEAAEREKKAAEKAEADKKRKKEEDDILKEGQLAANVTDVEITSVKKAGIALNPLGFLFPVQKQVGEVVVGLRIVKSIVVWQENFLAFWIVTLCLAGSFILFYVPFGFILRWTSRIVVWVALGPWMKLVDIYYVQAQTDDAAKSLQLRQTQLSQLITLKQINRERALKLKDITMYLFGKYLLRVPRFKEDRSPSYPLPASYASPKSQADEETVKFSARYYGQHLSGDMVPKRDVKILPKEAKPKSRRFLDPAAVPLLSGFGAKADYGAVRKSPFSRLFGKK